MSANETVAVRFLEPQISADAGCLRAPPAAYPQLAPLLAIPCDLAGYEKPLES